MKASNHTFLLLALFPIPKFIHKDKKVCSVLENCLTHKCIDFIVKPLKKVAEIGVMMSDPLGWHRYCFTPLIGAIIDYPKAGVYAGVGGKTSPVRMATYKQFGDSYQHEPQTASTTLTRLMEIKMTVHPWSLTPK